MVPMETAVWVGQFRWVGWFLSQPQTIHEVSVAKLSIWTDNAHMVSVEGQWLDS